MYKRVIILIIYADVLLAVNLYINYFLLRGATLLLRRRVTPLRCVAAAAVGAVFSLAVIFPQIPFFVGMLLKAISGAAVTLTAFGRQKRIDFLLSLLCFLVMSFAFAGGMTALWNAAAPLEMYCNNGCVYFDIPIWAAALITAALYGGFRLVSFIMERRQPSRHESVTLYADGHLLTLDGFADTGNSLRDSFSGMPVIIVSLEKIKSIAPKNVLDYLAGNLNDINGIRLVPCSTVTSDGVIPVFPAAVEIGSVRADVFVGVTRQPIKGADCIFSPDIIGLAINKQQL